MSLLARHSAALLAVCLTLTLAGCATPPADPYALEAYTRAQDPLEPTNRTIFAFNKGFQNIFISPPAKLYNALPSGIGQATSNFMANLSEPRNIVNGLLQGEPHDAGNALGRFLANTTLGLAGLINITGNQNTPPRDFGQTLSRWGGGPDPYLELPLLGSSSLNSTVGMFIDGFYSLPTLYANKTGKSAVPTAVSITKGVILYADHIDIIDQIHATSLDPYVSFRNAYQQRRKIAPADPTDDGTSMDFEIE